jgi:hypothetical protein
MSEVLHKTWLNSEYTDDGRAFAMPIRLVRDDPWFVCIDIGHDDKPDSAIARVSIHLGSDGKVTVFGERAKDFRQANTLEDVFDHTLLPLPGGET